MFNRKKSGSCLKTSHDKINKSRPIHGQLLLGLAVFIGMGSVSFAEQEKDVVQENSSEKTGQNSDPKPSDENLLDALPSRVLNYMVWKYIDKAPGYEQNYQTVYGNPEKARLVLIVWTSLGCPTCSEIHKTLLLPLESAIDSHSDFALIVRDYPHTPISLTASAMIWACAPNAIKELTHSLHHDLNWIAESEDSLDVLENQIDKKFPEYTAAAKKARRDDASRENVFQGRTADKAVLNLKNLPLAVVLEKQNGVWTGKRIDDPDGNTLKGNIFQALNSGMFFKSSV
jgi:hypothetical protein